jgi:hypothetical protein
MIPGYLCEGYPGIFLKIVAFWKYGGYNNIGNT